MATRLVDDTILVEYQFAAVGRSRHVAGARDGHGGRLTDIVAESGALAECAGASAEVVDDGGVDGARPRWA